MCTVVILRRPGHAWPLLLAGNRDELIDRPWRPPGRHWPDRPEVVAGLDVLAGGSWLGLNDHGVVAAALNRVGTLGPAEGKRSRGELVLEALDHATARDAAAALAELNPDAYRPFNLVVADAEDAFWLRNAEPAASGFFRDRDGRLHAVDPVRMPRGLDGSPPQPAPRRRRIDVRAIPAGLSMLTARELNDASSPRIRRYLPLFRAAPAPAPEADDWRAWEELLASREGGDDGDPTAAMTIVTGGKFGTVSSSLVALPAAFGPPIMRFAPGRPDEVAYAPVPLDGRGSGRPYRGGGEERNG